MIGNKDNLVEDDLIYEEVGKWSKQKYDLISNYAKIFATGMKNKWDCRVYIDLFAGPGMSRIKNTNRIIKASPLLSIDIPYKFDKYIFCEKDRRKIDSLQKRISGSYQEIDVTYVPGDVNDLSDDILERIPKHSVNMKVLSFCVVDPYSLENLAFNTIEKISSRFVDFLVLIPTFMDAHRNWRQYLSNENYNVERFL